MPYHYGNVPGRPGRPQQEYTPENFDRSWILPGSGGQFFADPNRSRGYQLPSGALGRAYVQNGQYGYRVRDVAGTSRFQPFQNQPQRVPLFISNPQAYQRQKLSDEMQQAMDEAKEQTEKRYEESMKDLENVGAQERADIGTRFDASRSGVNQALISSGLSGTSVLPSMQRGVERERTSALNRLATDLARERIALRGQRSDIPPNLALYAQLMQQQGTGRI